MSNNIQNNGIYWLASYPKSGNTWFRIVLSCLMQETKTTIDLNAINTGMIASCRSWMESSLGFETSDLTHDELDALRPTVYSDFHETLNSSGYHKIHDAYTYLPDGQALMPASASLGALYFVRNPLDVAISYANHSASTIDDAITFMGNPKATFCGKDKQYNNQIRQKLLTWSEHVTSWLNAPSLNVRVIRYEDLKLNTFETFKKAFQFLKMDITDHDLEIVLDNTRIENLQAQERAKGFREKPSKVENFFRKGMVGDWRTRLTDLQIRKIIDDHGAVMEQLGYRDEY